MENLGICGICDEQRFTLHAAALLKYMAANASRT